MVATLNDIQRWLDRAETRFVLIESDRFDGEDYPVYLDTEQEVRDRIDKNKSEDLIKTMEIYDMSGDVYSQLEKYRAWEIDYR